MSKKPPLTIAQKAKVRRMRNANHAWESIAGHLGLSVTKIRCECDPGFHQAHLKRLKEFREREANMILPRSIEDRIGVAPAQAAVEAGRALSEARARQSLADQILGNPPPGFSALDQKRAQQESKSSRVSV